MEYKAFKDLTKEERSEIVEAFVSGNEVEWHPEPSGKWMKAGWNAFYISEIYRIKSTGTWDVTA